MHSHRNEVEQVPVRVYISAVGSPEDSAVLRPDAFSLFLTTVLRALLINPSILQVDKENNSDEQTHIQHQLMALGPTALALEELNLYAESVPDETETPRQASNRRKQSRETLLESLQMAVRDATRNFPHLVLLFICDDIYVHRQNLLADTSSSRDTTITTTTFPPKQRQNLASMLERWRRPTSSLQ